MFELGNDTNNQAKAIDFTSKVKYGGIIAEKLDEALKKALEAREKGEVPTCDTNVLIVSRTGMGKSSQIKQWAKARGIQLVYPLGSIPEGQLSVLYLDHLNRAPLADNYSFLARLIKTHEVYDEESGEYKRAPGLLFAVAAINPKIPGYFVRELDDDIKSCFSVLNIDMPDTAQVRDYLLGKYQYFIDNYNEDDLEEDLFPGFKEDITTLQNRYAFADAILSSPSFSWCTEEEEIEETEKGWLARFFTPRGLEASLDRCDGSVEDLLEQAAGFMSTSKVEMIKSILKDYKD